MMLACHQLESLLEIDQAYQQQLQDDLKQNQIQLHTLENENNKLRSINKEYQNRVEKVENVIEDLRIELQKQRMVAKDQDEEIARLKEHISTLERSHKDDLSAKNKIIKQLKLQFAQEQFIAKRSKN